jgi:hypothetical protein
MFKSRGFVRRVTLSALLPATGTLVGTFMAEACTPTQDKQT